jgi:hypothetical protein
MIFAIVSFLSENKALSEAISANYPDNDFLQATPDTRLYFVTDSGTAKDVSDRLGISDGAFGSVVVLAVSGYFGRAPINVWEWVAATVAKPVKAKA